MIMVVMGVAKVAAVKQLIYGTSFPLKRLKMAPLFDSFKSRLENMIMN